jgi:hypothetical protein
MATIELSGSFRRRVLSLTRAVIEQEIGREPDVIVAPRAVQTSQDR